MYGKIINIRDYYIINHNEIMYYPDELYENFVNSYWQHNI